MKFVKKITKKVLAIMVCVTLLAVPLSGCQKKPLEKVRLSLWCANDEMELLGKMVEAFQTAYAKEAEFEITISKEEEDTCKDTVLSNIERAADIFFFAGDQFDQLRTEGALLEITQNTDKIYADNGGRDSAAIACSSADGKLYAYPVTASNGYFLYYNANYLTKEDVQSFDKLLEAAARCGKKISMDFGSGWYIYSFFKGAGLNVERNPDGLTNTCNWNSAEGKYKGTDVAEAMLQIAEHPSFLNCGDEAFVKGVQDGTIIAGINGAWNSNAVSKAWGDDYAAEKLPEYTVAGDSVQMCSFMGYKLVGVNSHTKNSRWAMQLAEWITNEENQRKRFEVRGEAPSNINAAQSEAVQKSVAIAALNRQSAYGYRQNVAESFWTPTYAFGTIIAAGNRDGKPLQELLDEMVRKIESAS